jgi:hypothetical protein
VQVFTIHISTVLASHVWNKYLYLSNRSLCVYWSEFLATDPEVWVRFPAPPDFLRSSGSGMGSTQPHEYNWGATWKKQ